MELSRALRGRACLLSVTFHHVRDANDPAFPHLHHRTTAQLREQLELLARELDFPPIDVVRDIVLGKTTLDDNVCLVTFDDALRDHHDHVLPVLEELKIPGLFLVNTGPWQDGRLLSVHLAHLLAAAYSYVDLAEDFERSARARGLAVSLADVPADKVATQYRYDSAEVGRVKFFLNVLLPQASRAAVLRDVFEARLGDEPACVAMHYLTPAMTREIVGRGHEVGLHTHKHLHLASASREERLADLAANRAALREHLGAAWRESRWIGYPYGSIDSFDDEVIADARAMGCDVGLTTLRGLQVADTISPMRLRRIDTNDAVGGKAPIPWAQLVA